MNHFQAKNAFELQRKITNPFLLILSAASAIKMVKDIEYDYTDITPPLTDILDDLRDIDEAQISQRAKLYLRRISGGIQEPVKLRSMYFMTLSEVQNATEELTQHFGALHRAVAWAWQKAELAEWQWREAILRGSMILPPLDLRDNPLLEREMEFIRQLTRGFSLEQLYEYYGSKDAVHDIINFIKKKINANSLEEIVSVYYIRQLDTLSTNVRPASFGSIKITVPLLNGQALYLTEAEKKAAADLAAGVDTFEIHQRDGISVNSAGRVRTNVLKQIGANSPIEGIRILFEIGFLAPLIQRNPRFFLIIGNYRGRKII